MSPAARIVTDHRYLTSGREHDKQDSQGQSKEIAAGCVIPHSFQAKLRKPSSTCDDNQMEASLRDGRGRLMSRWETSHYVRARSLSKSHDSKNWEESFKYVQTVIFRNVRRIKSFLRNLDQQKVPLTTLGNELTVHQTCHVNLSRTYSLQSFAWLLPNVFLS